MKFKIYAEIKKRVVYLVDAVDEAEAIDKHVHYQSEEIDDGITDDEIVEIEQVEPTP